MSLPRPRLPKTRRGRVLLVLSLGTFLLCLLLARPVSHLALTAWRDRDEVEALPAGFVDDASRLNRTAVAAIWEAPADSGDFEADLARLLADARAESRKVSIGGARHSMGGHTISPGGVALDMRPHRGMTLDEETELLTVQAGATWADVIAHLDPRGRSGGGDAVQQFVLRGRVAERELPRLAVRPPADRLDRRILPPDDRRRPGRAVRPDGERGTVFARAGRIRAVRGDAGRGAARRAERTVSAGTERRGPRPRRWRRSTPRSPGSRSRR